MTMVAKKPRVAIIGGGMAGLAAAHRLHTNSSLLDITLFEASHRLGGRILSSHFAGASVEMGATWIQGIAGSPLYGLAPHQSPDQPFERMDPIPSDPTTLSLSDHQPTLLDDSQIVRPITSLYNHLMDSVRSGTAVPNNSTGLGPFLRDGLRAYRRDRGSDCQASEDAVFEMMINEERVTTSADNIDDLDLRAEAEYRDFPGDHVTVPGGYSSIVDRLARALPEGTVRFGRLLRRVEWGLGDNDDAPVKLHFDGEYSSVETADHVIVTVSLGVLKSAVGGDNDELVFDPDLPHAKRDAIRRLGFGMVDKVFMEVMAEEEDDSSKNLTREFPFVQLALTGSASSVPSWMRRTVSIFPIFKKASVLLAWIVGKEATEMESLTDEEVVRGLQATLDAFKLRARVARVQRSSWGKDPLFLGSYSYVAVGSSGDDYDVMAEPLPHEDDNGARKLRLLFAGEATHRTHYSTTHGAYLSGIREANRLLEHYGIINGHLE